MDFEDLTLMSPDVQLHHLKKIYIYAFAAYSDKHLFFFRLSDCGVTAEGYGALVAALKSNSSHLVELDLRGNDPGDSAVNLLTTLHKLVSDENSKLQTLR